MIWKRLLIVLICCNSVNSIVCSAECGSSPAKEINLDLWSRRSLSSALYIQNADSSKKWLVGWIERNGTAFWSEDSKRLFLRDEYAADDTKIRVFDVTGTVPKEIKGLDSSIQNAIFARIPQNKTTQWLYYPKVCFAANDSSTIIVVADAPLVPKEGSGSGRPFNVKLTVNLIILQIVDSASQHTRQP